MGAIGASGLLQLLSQDTKNVMDAAGSVVIITATTMAINRPGIVLVLTKKGILQSLYSPSYFSSVSLEDLSTGRDPTDSPIQTLHSTSFNSWFILLQIV